MVKNRIREKLTNLNLSQAEVADKMPDLIGRVGMSFIATGKVLPTKDGMETLCDLLGCHVTDLYDEVDLDLLSSNDNDVQITSNEKDGCRNKRQHKGMTEFRCWLRPHEKDALEKAVYELGYRSSAEWLREMVRNTVARNRRLKTNPVGKAD